MTPEQERNIVDALNESIAWAGKDRTPFLRMSLPDPAHVAPEKGRVVILREQVERFRARYMELIAFVALVLDCAPEQVDGLRLMGRAYALLHGGRCLACAGTGIAPATPPGPAKTGGEPAP